MISRDVDDPNTRKQDDNNDEDEYSNEEYESKKWTYEMDS